jgi:REP element-mobilizing transposase RayT
MTRQPRQISSTGFYHIVFRGMNHCHVFEEPDDFEKFLSLLSSVKAELDIEVIAFCLLDNHAHIVLHEKVAGDIILAMRKLLGPYANWFNRKYLRSGSLVANRYKSECVEDDRYLFAVIRYIHQNPLVAGISTSLDEYPWSSYHAYISDKTALVDTSYILKTFAADKTKAIKGFIDFHSDIKDFKHSLSDRQNRTEAEIRAGIRTICGDIKPDELGRLSKQERNALLAIMRKQGFSIRQIERVTGIPRGIVARV